MRSKQGSGVVNVSKLRNSTAIDRVLELSAVSAALKANATGAFGELIQVDQPVKDLAPKGEVTANSVSVYLQGISASSCGEIDALISDLSGLREKLLADGNRIEQDIVEFAELNQSVIRLTEVVVDSVNHVKAPGVEE